MSENQEIDMLSGVEFGESDSLVDLHIERRSVSLQFAEEIISASDAYAGNCSANTLSGCLQAARESSDKLADITAESVHQVLSSKDGYGLDVKLQEVSSILCEDYFFRMNVYREALGLELIEMTTDDISDVIDMVSAAYEDGTDDPHDAIMTTYQTEQEPDFASFVSSLVLGEVDSWDDYDDTAEGNG